MDGEPADIPARPTGENDMVEYNPEKRIYLDCLLMIAEAAIEHVSEIQSAYDYCGLFTASPRYNIDMVYWLDRHTELVDKLFGRPT